MQYCSECGSEVALTAVANDQRERYLCSGCGRIHYENPRILVACLATWQNQIVMCRRAQEPARGLWTPPSGFMEKGETLEIAAARETLEEVGLELDASALDLYAVTNLPDISEVYVCFRTAISGPKPILQAGPESEATGFFGVGELPWEHLAYRQMRSFLRLFFAELHSGDFSIHVSRAGSIGNARRGYRILPRTDIADP